MKGRRRLAPGAAFLPAMPVCNICARAHVRFRKGAGRGSLCASKTFELTELVNCRCPRGRELFSVHDPRAGRPRVQGFPQKLDEELVGQLTRQRMADDMNGSKCSQLLIWYSSFRLCCSYSSRLCWQSTDRPCSCCQRWLAPSSLQEQVWPHACRMKSTPA